MNSMLRAVTVPAVLGLGLLALAVAAGQAETATGPAETKSPVTCGIDAVESGAMIAIDAAFRSDVATTGSYQFRVASSGPGGSSNISQGGNFEAGANDTVSLGKVTINKDAQYEIDFSVTANGVSLDCSKDIVSVR